MLTLLLVAGSVGADNFAAAIAIGLAGVDRQVRLRIAVVFGLFEAGMPVIGLVVGRSLSGSLGSRAHLVGGALLILVGLQMAVSTLRSEDDAPPALAGAPLARLIVLGAGLSIDNLVIGFALGARDTPLILSVVVIGVVSVGLSLLGLELGSRLGAGVGQRSELLGAGVLVAVGAAILTHTI
ncbi:MAG TPA: manganese efflux pump [Solirubrobacteraceae bacterium]|nr:manganese efflux pump [Solirubrobacteraceae bacterium]